MIVRIVKLTFQPESIPVFMEHFGKVSERIRAFPGCNRLELLVEVSHRHVIFTYSYWDSLEALNQYLQSPLFGETWRTVKPLFQSKAEAWSLNSLQLVEPL